SSLSTESLDPVLGGHVVKFYLDQIFEYLVGVTPDGQLSADGGLATRWETSPDHKRWTFHLRRGVKFHNGDELTSEDVKFSLQRAMGKRSTTGYAEPLRVLIKDIETPAPDRVVRRQSWRSVARARQLRRARACGASRAARTRTAISGGSCRGRTRRFAASASARPSTSPSSGPS